MLILEKEILDVNLKKLRISLMASEAVNCEGKDFLRCKMYLCFSSENKLNLKVNLSASSIFSESTTW